MHSYRVGFLWEPNILPDTRFFSLLSKFSTVANKGNCLTAFYEGCEKKNTKTKMNTNSSQFLLSLETGRTLSSLYGMDCGRRGLNDSLRVFLRLKVVPI